MSKTRSGINRLQPPPIPHPEPPEPGTVEVLCCETLLRFVADGPILARRVAQALEAWGVDCLALPSDSPKDVVAEVHGVAEQVHAVAAVTTANVALRWHPDQPADRRISALHGFPVRPPVGQENRR